MAVVEQLEQRCLTSACKAALYVSGGRAPKGRSPVQRNLKSEPRPNRIEKDEFPDRTQLRKFEEADQGVDWPSCKALILLALPRAGAQTIDINALLKVLATLISNASHSVVSQNEVATTKEDSGEPSDDTSDPKDNPR